MPHYRIGAALPRAREEPARSGQPAGTDTGAIGGHAQLAVGDNGWSELGRRRGDARPNDGAALLAVGGQAHYPARHATAFARIGDVRRSDFGAARQVSGAAVREIQPPRNTTTNRLLVSRPGTAARHGVTRPAL